MPYKQPGSKFWWISYADGFGGRIRRSSGETSYKEAKRIESEERGKRRRAGKYAFETLMTRYLEERGSERDSYAVMGLRPFFGGMNVNEITPDQINAYKRERGVSTGTVIKELRTFSAAINYAKKEWGWDIDNPILKRIPSQPEGRIRWLTRDEAGKLVDAAKQSPKAPYLPDLILLALNTGMRRNELLKLEWPRVDKEARLIYLHPEHQKGRRYDSIPLSDAALAVLKRREGIHDQWVFTYQDAPIQSVKRSFARACRLAKIQNFTFHDLRHTCAAWLVQAGVPIRTVAEILRHRDIRTTMRYAHLAPESARTALDAINYDANYDTNMAEYDESCHNSVIVDDEDNA